MRDLWKFANCYTSSPTFSQAQCCSHYSSERKKLSSTTRRKLHSPVCYKCDFDDLLVLKKVCFSLETALASRKSKINLQNAFLSEYSKNTILRKQKFLFKELREVSSFAHFEYINSEFFHDVEAYEIR